MTKDEIQTWLEEYAWLGTTEEQRREVACIMAQDNWQSLEVRKEQLRSQASGEETNLEADVIRYVLSELYECHDAPHLPTCPRGA